MTKENLPMAPFAGKFQKSGRFAIDLLPKRGYNEMK